MASLDIGEPGGPIETGGVRVNDRLRAADGDRERVAHRLHAALDEGRLTLAEYDERVRSAYEARTYAELYALLDDLPRPEDGPVTVPAEPHPVATAPRQRPTRDQRRLPPALAVLWIIWGSIVAVNVVVWLLACITTAQFIYPWPLWVALPSGAALGAVTYGVQTMRRSAG